MWPINKLLITLLFIFLLIPTLHSCTPAYQPPGGNLYKALCVEEKQCK